MYRTNNNFYSPPSQRPTTTVPQQQRFSPDRLINNKKILTLDQQEKLSNQPPLFLSIDKILQGSKAYKTDQNFMKRGRMMNANATLPYVNNGSPQQQQQQQQFSFRASNNNILLQSNQQSPQRASSNRKPTIINPSDKDQLQSGDNQQGSQTNLSLQMIGQGAKLSSVIYILGPLSGDLLYFIDNHSRIEQQINDQIAKMRAQDFSTLQKQRSQKLMNLYQKFFIDTVLAQEKEREGMKEIGLIMKKEFSTMLEDYERYIKNMEENFKRLNLFQEKDVILLTDFYEGLNMMTECYNYQLFELGSFGKTRPEQTIYIKSIHQFKTQLKSEPKNQKAFKLFDDIETLLKSQFEKIQNSVLKIEQLTGQNNELMKVCEQLQKEKHDMEFNRLKGIKEGTLKADTLSDTNQKYGIKVQQNQIQEDQQKSNIYYKDDFVSTHNTQLKIDNKRLTDQLQKTLKQLQQLQQQINGQNTGSQMTIANGGTNQSKQNGLKKYLMVDQEVQCVYTIENNAVTRRDYSILNILNNPHQFIKTANLQTREWCLMVVDMILTDKILSEMLDNSDNRPRTPLKVFVVEWFLRRFGNKDVAEILFKDFLISLKKYNRITERFKMFCEFCAMDDLLPETEQQESTTISNIGINRQKLKKIYMKTDDAMHFFYKIAYMVRMIGSNYFGQQNNLPLFQNIYLRGLDLVNSETAAKLWETLAEEDNLNKVDTQSIEVQFKKTFAWDVQQRTQQISQGGDPLGVYTIPSKDDEELCIRFDNYARQVLESVVDQRVFELEQLYTAMKLKSNPKNECMMQFDDFAKICSKSFPKKSQRWIEIAYREFCDGVLTDKTPLNIAILKLVPFMTDDDCVKENFLKIKANQSMMQDNSNASKFAQTKQQKSITQRNIVSKSPSTQKSVIKGNSKAGMDFQEPQIIQTQISEKDRMMQLQDHITNLGLLEESYKIMQPLILNLEKRNEGLVTLHDKFKEDMMVLPQNICKMQKYDEFNEYDKKDLMILLENAWSKFRKMLVYIAKTN